MTNVLAHHPDQKVDAALKMAGVNGLYWNSPENLQLVRDWQRLQASSNLPGGKLNADDREDFAVLLAMEVSKAEAIAEEIEASKGEELDISLMPKHPWMASSIQITRQSIKLVSQPSVAKLGRQLWRIP